MANNTNVHVEQAVRYGRLAMVAMNFYIQTGNLAELDAVAVYTRHAVTHARVALDR
jgi:hypothetical protein